MILDNGLGILTYCLNVHPTQTLTEIEAAITGPLGAVKSSVCPDAPFATGLRIPAEALAEIDTPEAVTAFRKLHQDRDLLPLTVNGFPYGPFHGTRVKEEVYLPDWSAPQRLDYTIRLADLMAELNPEGGFVSLSTVPGAFKPNAHGNEVLIADTILRAVAHLVSLEARTGRQVALAVEPEPFCMLETIEETIDFFHAHLMNAAARARVSELAGHSVDDTLLARHLGLCYDTCHAAVEFEDAGESLDALSAAGIPIHKLQLSSALSIAEGSDAARAALADFDEPTYLHQLVARAPSGEITRFADLPTALGPDGAKDGEEWRVHFHVPLFASQAGPFGTTQGFLQDILARHRKDPVSPHLEVETYTWGVMPEALRGRDLAAGIAREIDWVLRELSR